jgi:hypothetical protein
VRAFDDAVGDAAAAGMKAYQPTACALHAVAEGLFESLRIPLVRRLRSGDLEHEDRHR